MNLVELLPPLFAIILGALAAWLIARPAKPEPRDDDDYPSNYR